MASLNKATIIGHLGKDPEIRSLNNGNRIASFNVATSETWKDRNTGERKQQTEWHRITVWREGDVDFCDKYLRKGDMVYIEGKIKTRKWQDQQGNDRYSTEIHVEQFGCNLTSLEKANRGGGGGGDYADDGGYSNCGGNSGTGRLRERAQPERDASGRSSREDLDDEIPF